MAQAAIPTPIRVPDCVVMQDPQPRRLGELLKLTVRLLADLPSPAYVWVSRGCQEITLSFGSDPAAVDALNQWGARYGEPITGKRTTDSNGHEIVRCSLTVPNREGVHVEAIAYIRANQATS